MVDFPFDGRFVGNGRTHQGKSALGAVMRKQLTVMRAVIITGKPYDPNYKPCGKVSARQTQ